MKVILLKNIKNLGYKNETKEVKDGHALNFLIPQKLALSANLANLRKLQIQKEKGKARQEKEKAKNLKLAQKLKAIKKLIIKTKASPKGKLYASIGVLEIIKELKNQHRIKIEKKNLLLEEPIKEIGEYEVGYKLVGLPEIKLKVEVTLEA